jgi:hypothetical protein
VACPGGVGSSCALLGDFHFYTDQWKTGGSGELDYLLGEMHIDATPDSEVVVILEDFMALSDIKVMPAMAMKRDSPFARQLGKQHYANQEKTDIQ